MGGFSDLNHTKSGCIDQCLVEFLPRGMIAGSHWNYICTFCSDIYMKALCKGHLQMYVTLCLVVLINTIAELLIMLLETISHYDWVKQKFR